MIALKNALEELDQLITVTLKRGIAKAGPITEDLQKEWISVAERNKENIRLFLMRRACDIEHEKALELMVQQYQLSIITLLDTVFVYKQGNADAGLQVLFDGLMQILEDILANIEQRYGKYFNQDDKVPENYLHLCRKEIQLKIKPIKKRLKEKENDEQLIELAITGIHAFSINKSPRIVTYRRLIYIKDLISSLERQCTKNHFSNTAMIELFVYKNFNCARFVSYCIDKIAHKISLVQEDVNKIDQLAFCLKRINQMQVKPGFAFKQHSESVKEQVAAWVNEEILFLEQKQRAFPATPVSKHEAPIADEEKLHLSVSVDVMTLLARAAKDSKLILNKQMSGM
jgi:hypothetical protein